MPAKLDVLPEECCHNCFEAEQGLVASVWNTWFPYFPQRATLWDGFSCVLAWEAFGVLSTAESRSARRQRNIRDFLMALIWES